MEKIRVQKYLAEAGIASRRKAEELIKEGRVRINGVKILDMGIKVSPEDVIEVDGKKALLEEKKVYIMLNKPNGYVTTAKDQFGRAAVVNLIKGLKERIYPVGRLDYDTSGLLLLTNDGDFTFRLTHPKHEIEKVYEAEVEGIPDKKDMEKFREGIKIENYVTAPADLEVLGIEENTNKNKYGQISIVKITIHEGKNRQVRKMCDAIGHPVLKLKRIAIGKLELGELEEGTWRHLSDEEIGWLDI